MNGFGFEAVELQVVFTHPHLCLLQIGLQLSDRGGGRGGGSDLDMELCVISLVMEMYSMPADNTTEGKHV